MYGNCFVLSLVRGRYIVFGKYFCIFSLKQRFPAFEPYAPIFLIGFLGAFTTFSTLALESANMLLAGEYGRAALNLLIQNVSGVAAVFCGICAGRLI